MIFDPSLPFRYRPYDGSAPAFTISMKPLDLADWIEPDHHFVRDLATKAALLAAKRDVVFRQEAGSDAAQAETFHLLAAHLAGRCPHRFRRVGEGIEIVPTGQVVRPDAGEPLLMSAARMVQEDLCLLQREAEGWRLTAAALCFPSTWSLAEKIGRPMAAIHTGVPGYAGIMGERVARIFDHLKPEMPVWRLNWSIYGDAELHHPDVTSDPDQRFPPDEPLLRRAHVRVERQTLRRLPETGAILFTIRIYVDPLAALVGHPDQAALAQGLKQQLQAMTGEQLAYKGLTRHREPLVALLDDLASRV